MPPLQPHQRIIAAADVRDERGLQDAVFAVGGIVGMIKIGLEAIVGIGLERCLHVVHFNKPPGACPSVFVDGKFCDIPNTVGAAIRAVEAMSEAQRRPAGTRRATVGFINVHASCGTASMKAAVANRATAKILAVTVLTSIDDAECVSIFGKGARDKVRAFAEDALRAGVDGIVCSPLELEFLRDLPLIKVTPGVRPAWAAADDQKRVMTPGEAVRSGADYVVVGRPIFNPPSAIGSPADAVARIVEEIAAAEGGV